MIEITDAAAKRIQTAMVDEGRTEGGLRVGIKAGGCNGFSYVFKWEHAPSLDDEVFESPDGARIVYGNKMRAVDGTGDERILFEDKTSSRPAALSSRRRGLPTILSC